MHGMKGEMPISQLFIFLGRFVANLKRFLTPETKIDLKMGFEPPAHVL
jgi:hypothetical protein